MGDEQVRTLDQVVGANVRGRRAGLGLRQPDLAEAMVQLGEAAWKSASTVSRAESGERSLSLSEFMALAYALGATPDELLDPTAFGEESDVQAPTGPIGARAFRMIVRGEVRMRATPLPRGKWRHQFSPTDRALSQAETLSVMANAFMPGKGGR